MERKDQPKKSSESLESQETLTPPSSETLDQERLGSENPRLTLDEMLAKQRRLGYIPVQLPHPRFRWSSRFNVLKRPAK